MRAKRSKQYRKLMQQYAISFNFREPYQVLLDSQLILAASGFKMHLGSMLASTLHGEIKPMITQCCIRHLYNLPDSTPEKANCIEVAKAAERRRCGHHELDVPLSAVECLSSVVDPKGSGTNRHRYVVASQDEQVRRKMRSIAGVPLVYLKRSVMILEPMGGVSAEARQRDEKSKIRAGLKGRRSAATAQTGEKRKREDDDDVDVALPEQVEHGEAAQKKKKPRGPKGPNPLSVKKAAKANSAPSITREKSTVPKATSAKPAKRSSEIVEADESFPTTLPVLAAETAGSMKTVARPLLVQDGEREGVTEVQATKKRKRKRKENDAGGEIDINGRGEPVEV